MKSNPAPTLTESIRREDAVVRRAAATRNASRYYLTQWSSSSEGLLALISQREQEVLGSYAVGHGLIGRIRSYANRARAALTGQAPGLLQQVEKESSAMQRNSRTLERDISMTEQAKEALYHHNTALLHNLRDLGSTISELEGQAVDTSQEIEELKSQHASAQTPEERMDISIALRAKTAEARAIDKHLAGASREIVFCQNAYEFNEGHVDDMEQYADVSSKMLQLSQLMQTEIAATRAAMATGFSLVRQTEITRRNAEQVKSLTKRIYEIKTEMALRNSAYVHRDEAFQLYDPDTLALQQSSNLQITAGRRRQAIQDYERAKDILENFSIAG